MASPAIFEDNTFTGGGGHAIRLTTPGSYAFQGNTLAGFGADGSDPFDIMDYIGLGRVVSLSIVIGVIDVILFTAIATLGAFLYNVSAALVGGLQLTLTDD